MTSRCINTKCYKCPAHSPHPEHHYGPEAADFMSLVLIFLRSLGQCSPLWDVFGKLLCAPAGAHPIELPAPFSLPLGSRFTSTYDTEAAPKLCSFVLALDNNCTVIACLHRGQPTQHLAVQHALRPDLLQLWLGTVWSRLLSCRLATSHGMLHRDSCHEVGNTRSYNRISQCIKGHQSEWIALYNSQQANHFKCCPIDS